MTDNDFAPWRELGSVLEQHREGSGMSVVQAAVAAGFSESVWRQLEKGERRVGRDILPLNTRTENIVRAARVVGLDPNTALAIVGRRGIKTAERYIPDEPKSLNGKFSQLSEDDQAYVEALVDRLLGDQGGSE